MRPGLTQGSSHTAPRVACFPPGSNAITSLFPSYRKRSSASCSRSRAPTQSRPPLLKSCGLTTCEGNANSRSPSVRPGGPRANRWLGSRWPLLSASGARPHPCLLLSLFLKNRYLSSIFFLFDQLPGLEPQFCCLLTMRRGASPTGCQAQGSSSVERG